MIRKQYHEALNRNEDKIPNQLTEDLNRELN